MPWHKQKASDSVKKNGERGKGEASGSGVSRQRSRYHKRKRLLTRTKGESGLHSSPVFVALVGISLWLMVSLTVIFQHPFTVPDYVAGQVAEETLYADAGFEYVDFAQTEVKRREAMAREPLVFGIAEERIQNRLMLIDGLYHYFTEEDYPEVAMEEEAALSGEDPPGRRVESLASKLDADFSAKTVQETVADDRWRAGLTRALYTVLRRGVRPQNIDDLLVDFGGPRSVIRILDPGEQERSFVRAIEDVPSSRQALALVMEKLHEAIPGMDGPAAEIAAVIATDVITPNLVFQPDKTEEYRQQAMARVEQVLTTVSRGEVLVRRGETISREQLAKIRNYLRQAEPGIYAPVDPVEAAAAMALILVLVLGFGRGMLLFSRNTLDSHSQILLVALLVMAQVLMARLTIHVFHVHDISTFYLPAALPAAVAALFAAQLVELRTAVWTTVFTSIVIALQADNSMPLVVVGVIGGIVGALLVHRARLRVHMFWAGMWLGLAFFFAAAVFALGRGAPAEAFGRLAIVALINGLGSAILVSTLMPLFEYGFGLVTDISLLELSDLNHPLLRRLQIEAPGTFHHSLMVAILAEQAAKAIGANPLLARVCAYFHDVGKISQAEYFTENIMASGSGDAHSHLQPRMSSLIILNHVKEGLALAANYKLNKTMREAIAQHHGTSLIYYFYRRAADQHLQSGGDKKSLGQHDYRYPGPLPVRKEVVLIGLADACEAAARALQKPTPQKLKNLVGEIISNKLHDGQMDMADLTFEELAIAREAMIKTLCTMYHGRISYPDGEEAVKGTKNDRKNNSKSTQAANNRSGKNDRPG